MNTNKIMLRRMLRLLSTSFTAIFLSIPALAQLPCRTNADCDDSDQCTIDDCVNGLCVYLRDYTCGGAAQVCGNGIVEPGEECDDGNTNNGDRCSNRCKIIYDICPPGSFFDVWLEIGIDGNGGWECQKCPPGTHQPQPGQGACIPCPPNSLPNNNEGATGCNCVDGFQPDGNGNCVQLPECETDADCDDGDLCTDDFCVAGICVYLTIVCEDDGDVCTDDLCIEGECFYIPVSCDDGSVCTNDRCEDNGSGFPICVYDPITCEDDGDACTSDECDYILGCHYPVVVTCNDGNLCTSDECDPETGECVYIAIDCSDGNLCTNDECNDATGNCFNTPVDCDDYDPCTTERCNPANGDCLYSDADCDDNNRCTDDRCEPQTGCSYLPVVCNDGNICTIDYCDPTVGCIYIIDPQLCSNPCEGIACSDGDKCTNDICVQGNCIFPPKQCDDEDACTDDACEEGECVHTPVACDDGDPCTTDRCEDDGSGNAVCVNEPIDCDDDDVCTDDACEEGECIHTPVTCDDGNPCTTDRCEDDGSGNAVCVNEPIDCADNDACTDDACEEGACVHTPVACDDGDACTTDRCEDDGSGNAVCVNEPIDCADNDACTDDTCEEGECVHTPVACDDGDACTTDRCEDDGSGNAVCVNEPIDCADNDACTDDACEEGACVHTPVACDDGDACTHNLCDAATGCYYEELDCDDNNECTIDACSDGKCTHALIPNCGCDLSVEIVVSALPAWCQSDKLLLFADAPGATAYNWSVPGNHTAYLEVSAAGIYSVTVTDGACTAEDEFDAQELTELLSENLAGYTILATKDVHMHQNTVLSGGVGSTDNKGKAHLHKNSLVTAPRTFVRAHDIKLHTGSLAAVQIHQPAGVALPPFENNPNCNAGQNVNVANNATVTLTGSVYRDIKLGKNSTVIFTQPDLFIRNLYANENATIRFADCTRARVCQDVKLGKGGNINPDGHEVILFVEKAVDAGDGVKIIADIYALHDLKISKGTAAKPNELKGLFIARNVFAKEHTLWSQQQSCKTECLRDQNPPAAAKSAEADEQAGVAIPEKMIAGEVQMKAYPNPFSERVTVSFSLQQSQKARIDMISMEGKVIATLFDGVAGEREINLIEFHSGTLPSGMYFLRLTTESGELRNLKLLLTR